MLKYRAEWKVFVKPNVFANARIQRENPERLIEELNECPGLEVPTVDMLLYHLYVKKSAWAGKCDLIITVFED